MHCNEIKIHNNKLLGVILIGYLETNAKVLREILNEMQYLSLWQKRNS